MDLYGILQGLANAIWSTPVIFALFAVFIYISWKTGLPQRFIGLGMRTTFSGKNGVYKSLSVSLAAVLGVGNIVGIALAISLGGAGAVFWCWFAGLIGVGVQYSECLFSLKYRGKGKDGVRYGGPMYTMRATGHRRSGIIYALATVTTGLAMGALIPTNSVCEVLAPGQAQWFPVIAVCITILTAVVILGGAKSVFDFCAGIVPVIVIVYTCACIAVLFICRAFILEALGLILKEAFSMESAATGLTGYGIGRAVRWGVARGVFSSEVGMGTAGISAAAAGKGIDAQQAMGCACSTVWDTLIIATLTGIVFVTAALYGGYGFDNAILLANNAFINIPGVGRVVLPFCLAILGFATIIGWYYIAKEAFCFLTRGKGQKLFSLLWICAVFCGGVVTMELAWTLSDIFCAFMMVPNLLMILRLLPSAAGDVHILKRLAGSRKKQAEKGMIYGVKHT